FDLLRRDADGGIERRLNAAERRVGDAGQLLVGVDRRPGERDRGGKPPPHSNDHAEGNDKERQWRTKRNWFRPPGGVRRLASRAPSAKGRTGASAALPGAPATILPRGDRVVALLDKIPNTSHLRRLGLRRIRDPFERHQRWQAGLGQEKSGNLCVDGCFSQNFRFCAISQFPGLSFWSVLEAPLPRAANPAPRTSPNRVPPPTPPRMASARPTNSRKPPTPSMGQPAIPNASGSAGASCP